MKFIDRVEIEIEGWRTPLGCYEGYEIRNSHIFSNKYREFDATGIHFVSCVFEHCTPMFQHESGLQGCSYCTFISPDRISDTLS